MYPRFGPAGSKKINIEGRIGRMQVCKLISIVRNKVLVPPVMSTFLGRFFKNSFFGRFSEIENSVFFLHDSKIFHKSRALAGLPGH